ncbi:MAG: ethylbenzene dehydrogenase [Euryarchaeota archaeon]|nr:ethylbenzene dehydrogenase [Euryarchaeota archaeon]
MVGMLAAPAWAAENEVAAIKVAAPPAIDGKVDDLWSKAEAATFTTSGGANSGTSTVTMKAVYTDTDIYFLVEWTDPTESLRRSPWQKQADGTWAQLKDPSDKGGDNNLYYEDKLSLIWDINVEGFNQQGCFSTCHAGEAGKPYGNMYTPKEGQLADMWHMKTVRTSPVGYVDDQYLDATRYDPAKAKEAGRKSDPGAGGYKDNVNEAKTGPAFTADDQPAPPYWILDDQKKPFADAYKAGDEIAGIVIKPPTEDRADIKGKAVYSNGKWVMEAGRKLSTGSKYDVQFSDMKKEYQFGAAVFDNAAVRHSYSGILKLKFAEEMAPPTTAAPAATPAPKGVCGPTAVLLAGIVPLGLYGLRKRRL